MDYQNYIFDLDGTLYNGGKAITAAVKFINELLIQNRRIYFLTNNSTIPEEEIMQKLRKMNYPVELDSIITSSMIALDYSIQILVKNPYIVGERGLKDKFIFEKSKYVDAVICGLDREFNYEKLYDAAHYIGKGAKFIATNSDKILPTENGYSPGAGSILSSVAYATDVEPIIVGKPSKTCIEYLKKKLSITRENTIFVGDNLLTDIKQADDYGFDSIFVTTGVHDIDDIVRLQVKPKYISESLGLKGIEKYED